MKTEITKLFGIKYPIILPGMSWISVPELVAAVSNAGGLGILATGPLTREETRASIKRIRELTKKPFGIGCTLLMPGARENAEIALEEKVPVINISLGKGDDIMKPCHAYGGKVISTVTTVKHAIAAEKAGADALQVTGHEAAAHGGMVTSLVLVPAIKKAVKIPIISIGGYCDGKGLIAALSLGADGIGMGSRLSVTKESPVHDLTKKATIEMTEQDTLYSNRFDGLYCRVLDTKSARKAIRRGMSLPRAFFASFSGAKQVGVPWIKLAIGTIMRGPKIMFQLAHFVTSVALIKYATEDGDLKKGVHLIGQVQGLIDDIPSVKEVIDRTVKEAQIILSSLSKKI